MYDIGRGYIFFIKRKINIISRALSVVHRYLFLKNCWNNFI